MNGTLYFYNATMPQQGVLGTATMLNGRFVSFTGTTAQTMVENKRRETAFYRIAATDENVWNLLKNWNNGFLFCTTEPR